MLRASCTANGIALVNVVGRSWCSPRLRDDDDDRSRSSSIIGTSRSARIEFHGILLGRKNFAMYYDCPLLPRSSATSTAYSM